METQNEDGADVAEAVDSSVPSIKFKQLVMCLDCHPSEPVVASGCINGNISLHSYSAGQTDCKRQHKHHKESCRAVRFSPSGKRLYTTSTDKSLWCIDVETGGVRRKIKPAHETSINCLAVTGERFVVTGDDDGVIKLWDMRSKQSTMEMKECEDYISDMIVDDNAKILLATSGEGTLTAFNIRRKRMDMQSELHDSELLSLCAVRHQQKVVCGSGNGILYIFNWGEWGNMSDRFPGHPNSVSCMVALNDSIICTGSSDGFIRAVNILPNRFLGVVGEHSVGNQMFDVESLALSYDQQYIVSCSHDQCVKFWDISDVENEKINTKKRAKQVNKVKKIGKAKEANFFSGLSDEVPKGDGSGSGDDDSDDESDFDSDSD